MRTVTALLFEAQVAIVGEWVRRPETLTLGQTDGKNGTVTIRPRRSNQSFGYRQLWYFQHSLTAGSHRDEAAVMAGFGALYTARGLASDLRLDKGAGYGLGGRKGARVGAFGSVVEHGFQAFQQASDVLTAPLSPRSTRNTKARSNEPQVASLS